MGCLKNHADEPVFYLIRWRETINRENILVEKWKMDSRAKDQGSNHVSH